MSQLVAQLDFEEKVHEQTKLMLNIQYGQYLLKLRDDIKKEPITNP